MIVNTLRLLKGLYLSFMFVLFGFGIFMELLVIFPLMWIIQKIVKPTFSPLLYVNQKLFGFWLYLLRIGRLLVVMPPEGKLIDDPCIIVANHPGLFDVLVLIRDIPCLSVMVKRELVNKLPLGPIFRMSNYIVSGGARGKNTMTPLIEALEVIKKGYKLQLFPEGTRSYIGGLRPFKLGAFKIARMTGVPLQPVLIENNPPFLPSGARWYFPDLAVSYLKLKYLEPIPPPKAGFERQAAAELEKMYIHALGLETEIEKNSRKSCIES